MHHVRRQARDHVSEPTSRLAASGGHRAGHPREPSGDRRGGDGVGQDDPVAQDLPGAGAGEIQERTRRPDRAHPTETDRRARRGHPDRRRTRLRAGRPRRLSGALHRQDLAQQSGQTDDRRHPVGRVATRSPAAQVRHDHHRRGPRTQPQHRLPARLSQATPAPASRPEADHHVGDDRSGTFRGALR